MMRRTPTFRMVNKRRETLRWYRDFIAWTAAFAISGYPAAALVSTYFGIADNSVSVLFRVFVFALAIAAFLQGRTRVQLRPVFGLLVAFFLVYLFRLLWDTYIEEVPNADTALLFFSVAVIAPVIALALTANAWNDQNVALCLMIVGTFVSVGGIWLSMSGLVDMTQYEGAGRLGFQKVNPISLGYAATTTVLAAIAILDKTDSKTLRGISLVCVAIALAMLYLSASRGPVVSIVAALMAYVLFRGAWKYAMFAFVGLYVAIAIFSVINMDALLEHLRFTGLTGELDRSAGARLELFDEAMEAFKQNPLFGASFALPISGGWVHNIFIEAAMSIGIGGLILLVILCLRSFISSIHVFRTGNAMSAFLFLQFLVAAQFSGALWAWPGLWVGVALVNVVGVRKRMRIPRAPGSILYSAARANKLMRHIGRTKKLLPHSHQKMVNK